MKLVQVYLLGHACTLGLEDRQFLSHHSLVRLLCSYLLHLIPELLVLVLQILDHLLEVAILEDDVGDLAVLGHHVHLLEAPSDVLVVVGHLEQHLFKF